MLKVVLLSSVLYIILYVMVDGLSAALFEFYLLRFKIPPPIGYKILVNIPDPTKSYIISNYLAIRGEKKEEEILESLSHLAYWRSFLVTLFTTLVISVCFYLLITAITQEAKTISHIIIQVIIFIIALVTLSKILFFWENLKKKHIEVK